MNYATADEAALVAAAQAGDLDAFESLVRQHTQSVYAHAARFFGDASVAEDVVQEVFIKVYRSIGDFDERSRLSTWLYRVTRNVCLDQVRSGRRRPVPVDPLQIEVRLPGDLSDEVALKTSVEKAMRTLAPEDRDALSAISVFGLTYAEAGEVLGVPAGTVKSRVFRARRSLAAALGMSGGGA